MSSLPFSYIGGRLQRGAIISSTLVGRDLPSNLDLWFKYNDSEVSIVSKDEVLADRMRSAPNASLVGISLRS